MEKITFVEAIRNALRENLRDCSNTFIIGLGADYPNGADGTHQGLAASYPGRVLDTPMSESALTGLAVGAAAAGLRPIVHHGRVEFAIIAADQIFTQAAKWNFMFGGDYPCPLFVRVCIGRQWGNGPQHTQGLIGLFGNGTGLEVWVPFSPATAYQTIRYQREISGPTIMLEPRWLYKTTETYAEGELSSFTPVKELVAGSQVLLLSYGEGVQECLRAREALGETHDLVGVAAVQRINPLDIAEICRICDGYGHIIFFDTHNGPFGLSSEVLYHVQRELPRVKIDRIVAPHAPTPISPVAASTFYPNVAGITKKIATLLGTTFSDIPASVRELSLPPTFHFSMLEQDTQAAK